MADELELVMDIGTSGVDGGRKDNLYCRKWQLELKSF